VSMIDLHMINHYAVEEITDEMYIFRGEKGSVTRPQVYGDRGGAYTQGNLSLGEWIGEAISGDSDNYAHEFYDICSAIDGINPWRGIPDPDNMKSAADQIDEAVKCFRLEGLFDAPLPKSDSNVDNPGNLMNTLQVIQYEFQGYGEPGAPGYKPPAMEGESADIFEQSIRNIDTVFMGFQQIIQAISCAINAQVDFWTRVRECVLGILGHVVGACDKIVGSYFANYRSDVPGKDEAVLDLSILATIVGIVAPEAIVAGATVVSLGLSVMGYVESKTTSSSAISAGEYFVRSEELYGVTIPQISDYGSAMVALGTALGTVSFAGLGLNWAVITTENQFRSDITSVVRSVDGHRSLIKLTPDPIESTQNFHRRRGVDPTRTSTVSQLMKGFPDQLMQIEGYVYGAAIGRALHRDPRIGIGADGPAEEFDGLVDLVAIALDQLNWEIVEVRENFDAALAALDRANSANIALLQRTAAEIEQGYPSGYVGVDNFDYQRYEH